MFESKGDEWYRDNSLISLDESSRTRNSANGDCSKSESEFFFSLCVRHDTKSRRRTEVNSGRYEEGREIGGAV